MRPFSRGISITWRLTALILMTVVVVLGLGLAGLAVSNVRTFPRR